MFRFNSTLIYFRHQLQLTQIRFKDQIKMLALIKAVAYTIINYVLYSILIIFSQVVASFTYHSHDSRGLYYKTIMIIIMTIVSDTTIWSITYGHN